MQASRKGRFCSSCHCGNGRVRPVAVRCLSRSSVTTDRSMEAVESAPPRILSKVQVDTNRSGTYPFSPGHCGNTRGSHSRQWVRRRLHWRAIWDFSDVLPDALKYSPRRSPAEGNGFAFEKICYPVLMQEPIEPWYLRHLQIVESCSMPKSFVMYNLRVR